VTPTSDTPYAYSADTQNNGFKFAADAGDRVAISAHVTASNLPAKTTLSVVANWGGLKTWDWVDGADTRLNDAGMGSTLSIRQLE